MKDRHSPISLVLADDHPAVLHGIADVLNSNSDMNVVAACSDGAVALKAIRQWAPTVAVLDIFMPELSGLDLLASIVAERGVTKVVFLTATVSDGQLLTAIARGAKGVVLKEAPLNELVQCIRAVAAGRHWLPSDVIDAAFKREVGRESVGQRLGSLTSRERQIILMVAEGLSNKDVGRRLALSEGTVKIHLHNIYQKIAVNNRTALTVIAITHRQELVL